MFLSSVEVAPQALPISDLRMNKDWVPSHHRTFPEPHIQILKRPDDQTERSGWRNRHQGRSSAEPSIRRTSLTQEAKEASLMNMSLSKDPDSIANMEKGTTFAARARAAELNSARAAAAAKEAMACGGEADEIPELAPVSLGSLKFTRRSAQKASRSSKSQDPPVELSNRPNSSSSLPCELSNPLHPPTSKHDLEDAVHQAQNSATASRPTSRSGQPNELPGLGGYTSELNQQAIRQKVREVSAKQQSINNNNQDEAYCQGVPASISSSPYSSQGSRVDHALGRQKSETSTQHTRETWRQSEHKCEGTTSTSEPPHLLALASDSGNARFQAQDPNAFGGHLVERSEEEQPFSDSAHILSKGQTSKSDVSPLDFLPASIEACLSMNNSRSPGKNQQTSPHTNECQSHDPRFLNTGPPTSFSSHSDSARMSRTGDPAKQPGNGGYSQSPQCQGHTAHLLQNYRPSAMQSHTPNDTHFDMQQPQSPYIQNSNQSRGVENQSPYGPRSPPGHGQQMQSVNGHLKTLSQSRPKAMERFADLDQSRDLSMAQSWNKPKDDPFTDSTHSSSTIMPATQAYAMPTYLGVESSTSNPSATNSSYRPHPTNSESVPRTQAKPLLPAVKGTGRDHVVNQKRHGQSLLPDTLGQAKGRFSSSGTYRTDLAPDQDNSRRRQKESLYQLLEGKENGQASQSSTIVAGKTPSIRDPMPYTGFSASARNKEQLLGSLNRTINEAKAKGDLSNSNRSVLFDPVASKAGPGIDSGPSSRFRDPSHIAFSGSMDNPIQFDALMPDPPDTSSGRATPDYDPNILKDSEPMPPSIPRQEKETKSLSSRDNASGLRESRHGYSATTPRYPPGLNQTSNSFLDALNCDGAGFWDGTPTVNSGDPVIEEHVRALSPKSTTWLQEQMHTASKPDSLTWIEEQAQILLQTTHPTDQHLEKAMHMAVSAAQNPRYEDVRNVLLRTEGLDPLPLGLRYWQQFNEPQNPPQSENIPSTAGSRHAPIVSERKHASVTSQTSSARSTDAPDKSYVTTSTSLAEPTMSEQEIRKRAAIDVIAPVFANLASYAGGEDPGPLQRYSQPPAWCIDNTEAGRKSFFNDNWGDVPKRVGRDPRYQQTMHEGRSTYFEDPSPGGRRERDNVQGYKPTPGWGMNRK